MDKPNQHQVVVNGLLLIIILAMVATLHSFRWAFFKPFDYPYLKDLYDHSQWRIPNSPRGIGDSELYQVAGYDLVRGGDPFDINPEMPPLGKYLFGFSSLWLGNPYWVNIFLYLFTVFFLYLLTGYVFSSSAQRLLAVGLLVLNPLFAAQVSQTMLDLPQLCFFLGHLIFMFGYVSSSFSLPRRQVINVIGAGFFLGAFAAAKIGLFVPVILIADAWLLWQKKRLNSLPIILSLSLLTYGASYTNYFLSGHSLIEWWAAQNWVFNFYRITQVKPISLMVFLTLLTGAFKGWWGGGWTFVREWTVAWPISLVAFGSCLRKRRDLTSQDRRTSCYLTIVLVGFLGILALVPFWPRYLLLVWPLLSFWLVAFLIHKGRVWIAGSLGILLLQFGLYLIPRPGGVAGEIRTSWEKGMYKELYSYLSADAQRPISRENYWLQNAAVDRDLEVSGKEITIAVPPTHPWATRTETSLRIKYLTPAGEIVHQSPLWLVKEHGQWRLVWSWGYLLPEYRPEDQIVTELAETRSGSLKTSDGTVIAEEGDVWLISVYPNRLNEENDLITRLPFLVDKPLDEIRVDLLVRWPEDWLVPLGLLAPDHDQELFKRIKSDPALVVTNQKGLVYHPKLLRTRQLDKVDEIILQHPEVLPTQGGTITLLRSGSDPVVLLDTNSRDGRDVTLNQREEELFEPEGL